MMSLCCVKSLQVHRLWWIRDSIVEMVRFPDALWLFNQLPAFAEEMPEEVHQHIESLNNWATRRVGLQSACSSHSYCY